MPLTHLEYPLDEQRLCEVYEANKHLAEPYFDPRMSKPNYDWTILRLEEPYFEDIYADLGVRGKARFYYLKQHARINPHVDYNTLCSVNFILGDSNPAPIQIAGKNYFYRQAVLNTQAMHGVNNLDRDRLLFKISIFDKTYDQVIREIRFLKNREEVPGTPFATTI